MNVQKNDGSTDVFVMVPSYNHAPFIARCLSSIIEQTVRPKKLLVIDDGSADGSAEIIARILDTCPFDAELIVRENRGLCRILNQGLALSDNKYFAYIGSDDFWLPTFIESRVEMMESREEAVLGYGHAYLINEQGDAFDSTAKYTDSWGNYPDGNAREMLLAGIAPISSTVFYRRAAIENVGWNEDSRLEDYEMYLRLMNLGDFAFDPQILSAWRDHGYNTSKNRVMMLTEVLQAQEGYMTELGIDHDELAQIHTKTKFSYARDLLQHGDKIEAMRLAKTSWRGAKSTVQLLKFVLRMAVPMGVVNLRRRMKKTRPL